MANPSGTNQVLTKIYESVLNAIRVKVVGSVLVNTATNPTIENVAVPTSGTEQSYALPVDTKKFCIKSRIGSVIKLSYVSGDSNIKYVTIYPGSFYEEDNIITSSTIYFQTSKSSDTIEIISWS